MRRVLAVIAAVSAGAAALAVAPMAVHADAPPAPAQFLVGAAEADISPTAAQIASGHLYLGGYGFGNGQGSVGGNGYPVPVEGARAATGIMAEPLGRPFVRAIVISSGGHNAAFAELDAQGMFAAYENNPTTATPRPYGIDDARNQVVTATNGALGFRDITVSTDHSHGGQDLIGAWGFVPDSYLKLVHDQVVSAFVQAFDSRVPATLEEGAVQTPGGCDPTHILNNQFGDCPAPAAPSDAMDYELRTMQAHAVSDGHVVATIVNFAAHATVDGSSNTLVTPDWPGVLARYVEQQYGGIGITLVADVGREQPNRVGCTNAELAAAIAHTPGAYDVDSSSADQEVSSCQLSKYSRTVLSYVEASVTAQTAVTVGGVDGRDLFIHDNADNVPILVLDVNGNPVGAPIARSTSPPYLTGDTLGSWVGVYRIGDVLITTNPGEAYPNVRQQLMSVVSGVRRFWTVGLANDQLGYLIAPFPEQYSDAVKNGAGGNDNILFNLSPTLGDHVFCTQAKGAQQLGISVAALPLKCAPWTAEANDGPAPLFPSVNVAEAPFALLVVFAGATAAAVVRRRTRRTRPA